MVTVDAAVPFLPDFLPALLYGRKPLAAFGSVIEEYEIYENFLRWQAFASQQIPENPLSGCAMSIYCGTLKSLIPFIVVISLFVDGYNGAHPVRLCLGRLLHGSAAH